MGTQYNPNPNGSSLSGWEFTNVTGTATGDGVRLRKTTTGNGNALLQFAVPGSGRLTLAGVDITRNSNDPLPDTLSFGRNAGVSETSVELFRGWGAKGVRFSLPNISTPVSTSGSSYIIVSGSGRFDVTIRHLYVYAYGDSSATAQQTDLDSNDAAWSISVPDDALTATATWAAAPNEFVDQLEWRGSVSGPYEGGDARDTYNHALSWAYLNAGSVTASLTVRNFSGDSYTLSKTFQVPSGTYQADYAYETDYRHVEVDGSSSVGAVIERYSWNWGDGQQTLNQAVPYASHTYAAAGSYFVQLTITNSMGQTSTKGYSILVQDVPATPVDFTVELDKLAAVFTSQTTGTTYGWDFGDGGTASTAQAAHTYATAGTYTVVLTVDGKSASQLVTVTEDYVPLRIVDSLRLEVKQDPGEIVPWNRLPNPSGALGASGWTTPTSEFSGIAATTQGLRLVQAAGEALSAGAESVPVPVMPGRYVTGSFELVQVDSPCYVRAQVYVWDEGMAQVAATTITAYQNTPGTYWTGPVKVPSAGRYATLGIILYGSAGLTFPPVGAGLTWRQAMLSTSLYLSEATNPPYSEAGVWANILGPTHEIDISRAELDVSTLTATVLDATLDPAVADTIRSGQDVRLRVATDRNGSKVWEPLYTGRVQKASVSYGQSNLEDQVLSTTELVLNPTLTTNLDTYEVVDAGRFALAATVDGGKVTLTGYPTTNLFYWGAALKVPVTRGRDYRVKVRARRVSGGHSSGLRLHFRAFDSLDTDLGDVYADRIAPTSVIHDLAWNLPDPGAGVWRDNEFLVHAGDVPDGAATMNLWLNPRGDGTTSPNGEYTITNVSVVEEWTPPAMPTRRKSTRITLTAVDATARLAQITEPRQVALLQELPALMENSGVPVTVDGVGNTGPDPTLAAVNDNASLLDAVVAARDTQQGYAHVSRAGVLTLQTQQAVSTLPAATLDESVYADADVTFDTADAVNSLVVSWLRWDPTAGEDGETVETRYGPYEDLDSIRLWGLHRQEVTWVGQVENVPAIEADALDLLEANDTPERRIHSVDIPIRYSTDLSVSRALLDLMDLVRAKHTRTGLDQLLRVTEVHHTITARNGRTPAVWTMSVGFDADGTVARPIAVPKPPPSIPAAASGQIRGNDPSITWRAGWGQYDNGAAALLYTREGRIHNVNGTIRCTTADSLGHPTTIATGYPQPPADVNAYIPTNLGQMIRVILSTSGNILIAKVPTASSWSWVAGAYFSLNATWIA